MPWNRRKSAGRPSHNASELAQFRYWLATCFYEDSADRCIYPNYRRVLHMLFKDSPKAANSRNQHADTGSGGARPGMECEAQTGQWSDPLEYSKTRGAAERLAHGGSACVAQACSAQHAAVFCVDEKTAIQALDRKDPVLPLSPGRAERHGFEYYRSAHSRCTRRSTPKPVRCLARPRHDIPRRSSWLFSLTLSPINRAA
jgi:hypothetical protein